MLLIRRILGIRPSNRGEENSRRAGGWIDRNREHATGHAEWRAGWSNSQLSIQSEGQYFVTVIEAVSEPRESLQMAFSGQR